MSAEIAAVSISRAEAERITERIRLLTASVAQSVERLSDLIAEARDRGAAEALGYRSWTEYVAAEFADSPLRLDRDERRELVVSLAQQGMSTRAIAPVVGTHHDTVASDIKAAAPVGNPTPVTGTDGKNYTRPAPKPEPEIVDAELVENDDDTAEPEPTPSSKPRRRAITDQARDAGYELRKAVEHVERIYADDRFGTNKEQVAAQTRGHLTNAVEVCQDLLDRLNEQSGV